MDVRHSRHFCVSVGLSTPSDRPPTFGPFSENCYTIGGLWGRFYHQWLRRNISAAGMLVSRLLGIKKRTTVSRYSQILVGLGFSALIHMVGAVAGSNEDGGFWQDMFFFAQPVHIVVEETVIGIGNKLEFKKSSESNIVSFPLFFG